MKVSVLVPTYRRPADLIRCLEALAHQRRQADQLLVMARKDDVESREALASLQGRIPFHIVDVALGGVVAALNAGLDQVDGDIVCMTDDDAAPHPDWLERIVAHYEARPDVGGVGGRDCIYMNGRLLEGERATVGVIDGNGRLVGNHHLGVGPAREVDVLKGVNMSFRADLAKKIRLDARLKGTGAQVHNELALSLAVQREGWKLIYDPAVLVDHFPAQRFDEDRRSRPEAIALSNAAYNLMIILLEHFSGKRRERMWHWYRLVGTREAPGLLQVVRMLMKGDAGIIHRWKAARAGMAAAYRDAATR